METKGGFYITQIKQLQDRIFERLLLENGIEISGGQGGFYLSYGKRIILQSLK